MLDFTGPVTFAGPINVTNQVPDNQIAALIQALRENTEAVKESTMAKVKISDQLDQAIVEIGEIKTVGQSVNALVDRIVVILDSDNDAEAKVSQLRSGLSEHRADLAASVKKGTDAADEQEGTNVSPPVDPEPTPEGRSRR